MAASFISEAIVPLEASFDTSGMAQGEPGLPRRFRWHDREFTVAEVLERWKDHGDCRNGSGEHYVRKHGFLVRATDGTHLNLYFQRSVAKGKIGKARWWLHSLEESATPAVAS